MRILFLSQRFLLPMDTGGKIRTGKILEQLSKHHEIVVVGNYDPDKDSRYLTDMSRFCASYVGVDWHEPDRGSIGFYLRLARHLVSGFPVTALNDYSAKLESELLKTLTNGSFDLAVCDFVQSALLFEKITGIATLLFQHNVEAKIPLRHLRAAGNIFTKTLWSGQHKRMVAFESKMVNRFDKVIAVSENDVDIFQSEYGANNCVSIPTGVDVDFYTPASTDQITPKKIVFCGSMDWLPNEDGIKYFLAEIAPLLDARLQQWELIVVGRNPSQQMKDEVAKTGNVTLTGWVDDVRPFLEEAAVCVVPLRIGGGTRMKIYEAMAMSKAVISTTIGAEGLDYDDGRNIRIADAPAAFADAITELVLNTAARDSMGDAARRLVVENFGWRNVAHRFGDICQDTVDAYAAACNDSGKSSFKN